MARIPKKLRLTVDVLPLMDIQWTGIPIFTRRVVQSVLLRPELQVEFCCDLVRVDAADIETAIRVNSGAMLRENFERKASTGGSLVDAGQPIFYPSAKKFHGVSAREAVTVHDISPLVMPENHESANVEFHLDQLDRALISSDAVFCVSKATEEALHATFPSAKSKTRLLYQYADWPSEFEEIERNLDPPRFGPYVVVVGTLEPRKNLQLIFQSLAEPAIRDSDVKFVVIGRKGWKVDEFLAELPSESRERVIFTGFVTEFAKYRLLRHCEFLVFPSIYEGFGIPALEAMSLGKPVLASMTTSFPEVIGEAGIYFDPLSPSEFSHGFEEMTNPSRYLELSKNAVLQASTFNSARLSDTIYQWLKDRI